MRMQQTFTKRVQETALLGWGGHPQEIVQEIKIWLCWQIEYAQTSCPRKWDL